jgi:hypothetical protein
VDFRLIDFDGPSGSLERCIAGAAVIEVCRPQFEAFVQTRSAFQHRRAVLAAAKADETVRPSVV